MKTFSAWRFSWYAAGWAENTTMSYQVMGTWIYIVGFHRRVKVPSVRSILYSTT